MSETETTKPISDAAIELALLLWNFGDIKDANDFAEIAAPRIQSAFDTLTADRDATIAMLKEEIAALKAERQVVPDGLIERLRKCRSMIGNMCSEGRPPRMEIPARHDEYNEDIFICDTLKIVEAMLNAAPPADMLTAAAVRDAALEEAAMLFDRVCDSIRSDAIRALKHGEGK